MSLIGTLEQFSLSKVLQRLETFEKTGLLKVQQGEHWVDFYFQGGRLLCIGPVRTTASLGDRLVHDKRISQQALREVKTSLGNVQANETQMALALMNLGHISREELRAWAILKATDVLSVIITWSSGEMYFEDGTPPPGDRLLVGMSVTSMLEEMPQPALPVPVQPVQPARSVQPVQTAPAVYSTVVFNTGYMPTPVNPVRPTAPGTPRADIARVPTLMGAAQFFGSPSGINDTLPSTEALLPIISASNSDSNLSPLMERPGVNFATMGNTNESNIVALADANDTGFSSLLDSNEFNFAALGDENDNSFGSSFAPDTPPVQASSILPEQVMYPVQPKRIDTSFMQPDMVLVPADLSAYREQNPRIQITPEQWQILICLNGEMTLQMVCQTLNARPEMVCQFAGELVAEGLIHVVPFEQVSPTRELSPSSRDMVASGLGNGYMAPGYAAASAPPWSASVPAFPLADVAPPFAMAQPFETECQWGNGGNGAAFIPGRGWITAPQPIQHLPTSGPLGIQSGSYAHVGGY